MQLACIPRTYRNESKLRHANIPTNTDCFTRGQHFQVDYRSLVEYCNLWRNFGDIQDSWQSMTTIMDYYAMKQDFWNHYTGPGHWNDPDMVRTDAAKFVSFID